MKQISDEIYFIQAETAKELESNSLGYKKTGFSAPVVDALQGQINLNRTFIKNPSTTFYGRAVGNHLRGIGIDDMDLLIIDKSLPLADGKIAVCFLDGEFKLRKIQFQRDKVYLSSGDKNIAPTLLSNENQHVIWGILTYVIKKF